MSNKLVSVIIPTKNASELLPACLRSIRKQSYKNVEVLIVDGKSENRDKTTQLAKKYGCRLYTFVPDVKKGLFDATGKRNYVKEKAKGKYIYHIDADMELTEQVIREAVALCEQGYDAITIPEDSFGQGPWAQAKMLERRFFWGDDTVESPRFFKKRVWDAVGGYDESMGAGGEDRDIGIKTRLAGYAIGRINSLVMHNEGNLRLRDVFIKQFMYKREVLKFIKKRPLMGIVGYFPIRKAHFTNWRMFVSYPLETILFVIMMMVESVAAVLGMLYALLQGELAPNGNKNV